MSLDSVRELSGWGTKREPDSAPKSWRSYWEVPAIAQQKGEHFLQSQEYVRRLEGAIGLDQKMSVLDFGCGFGFVGEALAPKVAQVFLWDASANMRSQAQRLLAHCQNVQLLDMSDEQTLSRPLSLALDLILVNSVVQYMEIEEFSSWLRRWGDMLAPHGRVVLSDMIPSVPPPLFLELYESFMFNVKRGLLHHLLSRSNFAALKRYRKTSQATGLLLRLEEDTLHRLAYDAGLAVEMLPTNLTYFSRRKTAVLFRLSSQKS